MRNKQDSVDPTEESFSSQYPKPKKPAQQNVPIYHVARFKEPKNFNKIPLKMRSPERQSNVIPYNYSQIAQKNSGQQPKRSRLVSDLQAAQLSQCSSIETKQSEERKSEQSDRSHNTLINEAATPKQREEPGITPTLSVCGKSWQDSGFKNKKSLLK